LPRPSTSSIRRLCRRIAAILRPEWADRLERLAAACGALAASLSMCEAGTIHRDFYPDQVLVDGDRLYLLDLDLYCLGDPALDIGNFCAHLVEQALRTQGNAIWNSRARIDATRSRPTRPSLWPGTSRSARGFPNAVRTPSSSWNSAKNGSA
jgi:aminoglycoside phosphotransferase (APT) family kinase protein